jgi:hypothetical protein
LRKNLRRDGFAWVSWLASGKTPRQWQLLETRVEQQDAGFFLLIVMLSKQHGAGFSVA